MLTAFSSYRIMWLFVSFDLPTGTLGQRRRYATFRKKLKKDGFNMFQFSVYVRHCSSVQNAEVHYRRVEAIIPPQGHVSIMMLTDKQFAMIRNYHGSERTMPESYDQLCMFVD